MTINVVNGMLQHVENFFTMPHLFMFTNIKQINEISVGVCSFTVLKRTKCFFSMFIHLLNELPVERFMSCLLNVQFVYSPTKSIVPSVAWRLKSHPQGEG